MTKAATQFNELGTSWNAIVTAARRGPGIPRQYSEQLTFDVARDRA